MPQFAYEARTDSGQVTTGYVRADSLDHAGRLLSDRNLFIVRLAGNASKKSATRPLSHIPRARVAWSLSQLALMVETGIRLSDALECVARQATHTSLKRVLNGVSKTVHDGRPLSDAMNEYPRAFDSSSVALIRASEMNGTLSQVLRRAANYLMKDQQIMRQVRAALLYPAFMFVTCGTVTVFLLTFILPRFAQVFASRNAILPAPTRLLMAISNSLIHQWYIWTLISISLMVAGWLWSRTTLALRQRDYVLVTFPLFASIFKPLYQSRMFRAFAVLLETGVPLLDALRQVKEIVPNVYYRELWTDVEDQIQRGEHMSPPLLESRLISEPVAQMIDIGERSAKLGVVFGRLADHMEQEYDRAVRTATQFLEPIMILVMGSIIGFVAASLLLPLFQASRVIAG